MIYFTYGRKKVDDVWNHPNGFLPESSSYAIEYMANYYGSLEAADLSCLADFDASEISKSMYDDAINAQPTASTSGSI